jgi:co-chaperonin GroES (HSP10)
MTPTVGNVFVEKVNPKNKQKFEVIDSSEMQYRVTKIGKNVVACKKGDFILFKDSRTYKCDGSEIIVVEENDIEGVK